MKPTKDSIIERARNLGISFVQISAGTDGGTFISVIYEERDPKGELQFDQIDVANGAAEFRGWALEMIDCTDFYDVSIEELKALLEEAV